MDKSRLQTNGRAVCVCMLLAFWSAYGYAESVYQQPVDFLTEVFAGQQPEPQLLWVTDDLRSAATAAGVELTALRVRYWQQGNRSAWILDEIGKELPITAGVVVNAGEIEVIRVLVFRESRGWEVRYPFFSDQFIGVRLIKQRDLSRDIDNISGATLSVNALKRQARLALLLAARLTP